MDNERGYKKNDECSVLWLVINNEITTKKISQDAEEMNQIGSEEKIKENNSEINKKEYICKKDKIEYQNMIDTVNLLLD